MLTFIVFLLTGLNSSPDSLNPSQSTSSSPPTTTDPEQPQSLIERYSAKHSSKIPIPVLSKNRSRHSLLNANQQRVLKAQIRDSVNCTNGAIANNSKVDQIIADLLIEALNHSTDIGIEFIKAPKIPQSHVKLNQTTKRTNLNARRTNGVAVSGSSSGGKRSSHGSAKYQQVFDAIPEEDKSGSLSIESPNEQNGSSEPADQTDNAQSPGKTTKEIATKNASSPKISNKTNSPKPSIKETQLKVASGKAAIESDQDKSEAWFGCFGRTHVDSPSDGLIMDEGIFKMVHSTSLDV